MKSENDKLESCFISDAGVLSKLPAMWGEFVTEDGKRYISPLVYFKKPKPMTDEAFDVIVRSLKPHLRVGVIVRANGEIKT